MRGRSVSPSGAAIAAHNTATSGEALGVIVSTSSPAGIGILAQANAGTDAAVRGVAGNGGTAIKGVAVEGGSIGGSFQGERFGLQVTGPVTFSATGRATIGNGSTSVDVGGEDLGLDPQSGLVLATLLSNPGGTTSVQRVQITGTNSFTIHLTAAATANTVVGWFAMAR